jgi:hypothetical protein
MGGAGGGSSLFSAEGVGRETGGCNAGSLRQRYDDICRDRRKAQTFGGRWTVEGRVESDCVNKLRTSELDRVTDTGPEEDAERRGWYFDMFKYHLVGSEQVTQGP